ncbi:ATP-binding cassette domain-containing protein [Acidovorax sp. SUPP2539]|uniref:ATP-binding cassette domain-containing protein n=1 Tax=Acidovorax sp. SUPP2539 TaxID=2920878 RepID=UPI0023DE2E37|nr:ATP-binding cassette domain-containing protein [Acidovorax sp. SUPP2539]GKS89885.1 ATP-binding cassette domain-containing protein [Acidovorax sp. SUPP2539]
MPAYEIRTMNVHESKKNLVLANKQGQESHVSVHRFAMLGPGDAIHLVDAGSNPHITVRPTEARGEIIVLPRFESHRDVRLGAERMPVIFTEISTEEELREYRRLSQFHYKGVDLRPSHERVGSVKGTGGRKAILLAVFQREGMTRAVGYIEIQMPLLMCKPRHDLFSRPFQSKAKGISWNTWLGDGQKHVNRIARIARVVIDPEFRGIGLSTMLVEEAKTFCRDRWHIGGARPLFLEISAEMLRYMDFVSRAGLRFVGNTEGNLQRIAKDLKSIENGASGKSGIMSLQRKYHSAFTAYCEKTGKTFAEARLILSELLSSEDPRSEMASDEWLAFRPILRLPIPYFLTGLDAESEEYIDEGLSTRGHERRRLPAKATGANLIDTLEYKGIEVSVHYSIPLTPYVRLIMDSFGIDTNEIHTKIVGPVDVSLSRGNVTLITGASGAGKSVLLQTLSGSEMPEGLLKVTQDAPVVDKCRTLTPLPDGVPIFQYFADQYGAERVFDALCHVGLSEAMIFIKPFELLSMGQRYRAMFADLILSDAKLWLIDEFCSNLDPITSKILSIRLRRLAISKDCFVVVAAANTSNYIDALAPDRILVVRTGGEVRSMSMREYNNGFFNKGF